MDNIEPLFEDVARYAITRDELTCMNIQKHFSIGQSRAMKLFKMLHCFSVTEKPDPHGVSVVKCKDEESLKPLLVLARQTERATAKFLARFESTGNLHS